MPLFLIIVPADEAERARRHPTWADEVVRDGSDEMRADLALCHVFCAPIDGLRRGLPEEYDAAIGAALGSAPGAEASDRRPEPWALVIETDRPSILALDLSPIPPPDPDASPESRASRERARRRLLESSIRGVVLPEPAALARRLEQYRAAHGRGATGPAVERAALEADPENRLERLRRLARSAGPRVRPPRAPLREGQRPGLPCGAGYMPSTGERFLDVFTRE